MVRGGPVVQLGVIFLSVLGLWVGARLLVDAVVRLARRFGLSDLIIGLTIVAMGTSMPELAVSIDAALKGFGDIAVSNVLGSNIYNLAFILGVVSLIKILPIAESLVHRGGIALLASVFVGGLAVVDLRITRLDGLFLVGSFVAYTVYLLRTSRAASAQSTQQPLVDGGVTGQIAERSSFRGRDAVLFVSGLALVLVSGDYMVLAASELARGAGISEWVIGGTIVAAGTSTPEFAVSLVAIKRGSLGISVGNVIGSNIFNITGIMGIAAVVRPLVVSGTALETLAWLVVISTVLVAALWTGRVLSRLEGALLTITEMVRWVLGLFGLFG
ncbi:calcium/sodium antiporter [Halomicroarcula sp. F13]|uniref:Calcium/sodium antiporter n=1 Tax=Haloarcula rubra TaxID=2487747 RepID=A0AAW4Q0I4_9EURY|nr:calcium/sodium antiporter [Halomicroarcula rubra]MBX0325977.1 calcium/sodium antiporter [Halomicroarcula rubra]